LAKKAVDEKLLKVDVTTLKTKIDSIVENGKKKNAEIQILKEKIKEIGNIEYSEEEYKACKKRSDELIALMATLRTEINQLKQQNTALEKAEFCPTCHRKLDNVDNSGLIKANNEKIASKTKEGVDAKSENDKLSKIMDDMSEKRTQQQEKNKLELNCSALENSIAQQRLEYKEKTQLLNEIKENEATIKKNAEIDAQINVINTNISNEETIKNRHNSSIQTNNIEMSKNTENIELKKSYIVKIDIEQKTEKHWKVYLQMIGKDGISKMVLRNTLPIINSELNRMLSDVTDFEVQVTMNDKNDIDFLLIRDGVTTRLSAASGLEKTQASLALRVVLGRMSKLSRPPFILLDEVLGTVASENYDDMKKLYDKIVECYEFVLHICHIDLDWYDGNIVTIVKENNISRIKE
jgi:DNA repair exonuclease SbcCD ATPase subunit